LADDWRAAKEAIDQAQAEHDDPGQPPCILIVNGSSRSEHTCPGEMSKSWRLTEIAREICEADGMKVRILNLSRLAKLELAVTDSRIAILTDGTQLPVSRSGYARLRELL
jgi:hypothetical protein